MSKPYKKYSIECTYDTGDSFKTYETSQCIELEWDDVEIAKMNLKRIQEHKEWYDELHGWNWRDKTAERPEWHKRLSKEQKESWEYGENEYCIFLQADNGSEMKIHAFWIGYFEHLKTATIIFTPTDDTEMQIRF